MMNGCIERLMSGVGACVKSSCRMDDGCVFSGKRNAVYATRCHEDGVLMVMW